MEIIMSYIAKGIVLIMSMVLYVYLFSTVVPKFIMKLRCKVNTCDRGIRKYKYPDGRCVVYEPEISLRKYVESYALYVRDGYKYITCKTTENVRDMRYEVYAFDTNDKLIDILSVLETVKNRCTQEVSIPPETSYVRLVIRKVDNEYYSKKVVAEYSTFSYCLCATVVAVATLIESFIVYFLIKDVLTNIYVVNFFIHVLRVKIDVMGIFGMFFMAILISLIVAGLTVLAYRRNCKKVINK